MNLTKENIISKIHLVISICIVFPVSILYGFYPNLKFDISPNTIDEHNFFKAVMGLYIAFTILWVLGVLKNRFLNIALISNMFFMFGLGFGRIVSCIIDGTPTFGYIFGTFAEIFLGGYGLWVLTNKNTNFAKN